MIDCKRRGEQFRAATRRREVGRDGTDLLGGVASPLDGADGILGCSNGPPAPGGLGPGRLGHAGLQTRVEYRVFVCGEVKDVRPKFGGKSFRHYSVYLRYRGVCVFVRAARVHCHVVSGKV
jgi:hypothetical protein